LAGKLARNPVGIAQPLAQRLVAFAHRLLEPADGALGDFRRGDELGDGGAQRLLVGLEHLQLLIEAHTIKDREQQQNRDHAFDGKAEIHHCVSSRLVVSSAFSNIAKVVFGFRNGLATRTATRSPTRPMRPSVSVTSPQRTLTIASGFISSVSVSPALRFIILRNGSCAS